MEEKNKLLAEFKKLTTIFWAMLFGMVMLYATSLLIVMQAGPLAGPESLPQFFDFGLPIIILGLIPLSYMVYNNLVKGKRQEEDLWEKMRAFSQASVIRFAILEATAMLTVVRFLLTYSRQDTYLFVALVIVFLMSRPGTGRFINDLNIRGEQKNYVEENLRQPKK